MARAGQYIDQYVHVTCFQSCFVSYIYGPGDHFQLQEWFHGPVWVAKFDPVGTSFGKMGPFLATRSGLGGPFLAAKIGPGDHFWVRPISRDKCETPITVSGYMSCVINVEKSTSPIFRHQSPVFFLLIWNSPDLPVIELEGLDIL